MRPSAYIYMCNSYYPFISFISFTVRIFIDLSLCTLRFMCLLKILPHFLHCTICRSPVILHVLFCVSSFDFQFYLYSTFIALSPELCRFNICLTPVTKKQILSGHSCKYSNPNGSSPKSRRKNVCRLPNPNRQVRKGLGATNIQSSKILLQIYQIFFWSFVARSIRSPSGSSSTQYFIKTVQVANLQVKILIDLG